MSLKQEINGNYFFYDGNLNYKIAKENYGWKEVSKPFDRTFRKFSNVDDMHENGIHDYLKFIKFGLWEGKSDKEIKELFPDQFKKRKLNKWHYKIPQGESYEILYKRVKKFINKRIKFKKNYVIFTHDMVSRVFRGYLMKYKKEKILNSRHKNSSIFICDKKKIKEIRL